MTELSTFLFARPSAREGIARILDFGDTLNEYNRSPTGALADLIALWADWSVVGRDLRSAVPAWLKEHPGVEAIEEEEATIH